MPSSTSSSVASSTTVCANLQIINYEDIDGDGLQDSGEDGLSGFVFTVSAGSYYSNVVSDSDGAIYVSCLPAGLYTINETVPAGSGAHTGNPQEVDLLMGYTARVTFGNRRALTSTSSTVVSNAPTTTIQTHGNSDVQETSTTTTTIMMAMDATTTTSLGSATTRVMNTTTTTVMDVTTTTAYDIGSTTSNAVTSLAAVSTLYSSAGSTIGPTTTEVVSFVTYVPMPTLSGGQTEATGKQGDGEDVSDAMHRISATTTPLKGYSDAIPEEMEETPVADAGGPYDASVGVPVVFNASGSSPKDKIIRYIWDYGDGQFSEGAVAEHIYKSPGLYRATLSVVDDSGRSDLDSRAVYVSESAVYIDISAYPQQERYAIGDALSGVEAFVYYPNGSGIDGLSLSGRISGRVNVSLSYAGVGNGRYRARLDYPIISGEGAFIDVYADAVDSRGNVVSAVKKLILVPEESDLKS